MDRRPLLTPEQIAAIKRKAAEFEHAKPKSERILSPTYQRRFKGLMQIKQQLSTKGDLCRKH